MSLHFRCPAILTCCTEPCSTIQCMVNIHMVNIRQRWTARFCNESIEQATQWCRQQCSPCVIYSIHSTRCGHCIAVHTAQQCTPHSTPGVQHPTPTQHSTHTGHSHARERSRAQRHAIGIHHHSTAVLPVCPVQCTGLSRVSPMCPIPPCPLPVP